eukprot:7379949-Prymnesium_polylepis.1
MATTPKARSARSESDTRAVRVPASVTFCMEPWPAAAFGLQPTPLRFLRMCSSRRPHRRTHFRGSRGSAIDSTELVCGCAALSKAQP